MLLYYLVIGIFMGNSLVESFNFIREPGIRYPPTAGEVWPKPEQQRKKNTFYIVRTENFSFQKISEYSCDILDEAINRYRNILVTTAVNAKRKKQFADNTTKVMRVNTLFREYLTALDIDLRAPCEYLPRLNMDESYTFNVSHGNALLESDSIWGILRGLETFSQLLTSTDDGLLRINSTIITDAPRFSHRGLLLDTSRHFISVPIILKILDGMSYNKLNVFHWHIVDDESFPYQSIIYPELSAQGAYHSGMVYTTGDVQRIIQYARLLGIRVVVEFDSPGHTRSWGVAHPEILTACEGDLHGKYGPINPINEQTYKFVDKLWEEIAEVFPDDFVHIGGDEVNFDCWRSNKNISKYMLENNVIDYDELEERYIKHVIDKFNSLNQTVIVWQEVFLNSVRLAKGTVVHIWNGNRKLLLSQVTKKGYPTILSECWYLDHLNNDWDKFYGCDPHDWNGTFSQKQLVLGGEACMWSEVVDDENVLQRIFPRLCAAAEKLWSVENADYVRRATHRLEEHVCRMKVRGIPVSPASGPSACYL